MILGGEKPPAIVGERAGLVTLPWTAAFARELHAHETVGGIVAVAGARLGGGAVAGVEGLTQLDQTPMAIVAGDGGGVAQRTIGAVRVDAHHSLRRLLPLRAVVDPGGGEAVRGGDPAGTAIAVKVAVRGPVARMPRVEGRGNRLEL
jgi:hypothetical protein